MEPCPQPYRSTLFPTLRWVFSLDLSMAKQLGGPRARWTTAWLDHRAAPDQSQWKLFFDWLGCHLTLLVQFTTACFLFSKSQDLFWSRQTSCSSDSVHSFYLKIRSYSILSTMLFLGLCSLTEFENKKTILGNDVTITSQYLCLIKASFSLAS